MWISVDMNVCWSEIYAFFRHLEFLSFLYRKDVGLFISRDNGFLFYAININNFWRIKIITVKLNIVS